jgi:pimeloyl-ACP methyl ester carboxylesterase
MVDVHGVRLAYREIGPAGGVPVVALHGMASGAATWDGIAADLAARGRRVIAVDLPGHGHSSRLPQYELPTMRDHLVGFLAQLGAERVDLVGHSLGGYVATLIAARAPSQVRRLVLEDAPAPPDPSWQLPDGQAAGEAQRLPGRRRLLLQNLFVLTRIRMFDVRMASPIVAQLRTPDSPWWQELTRIRARTLLVSGGTTSHVPTEPLQRMATVIPDCQLMTITGAGHRIHSTRPTEFIDVVAPFLTGH